MDHFRDRNRRRHRKARGTRRKLLSVSDRPRLAVFRSNRYVYAQIIDDRAGRTLAAASSREKDLASPADGTKGKTGVAVRVGLALAERAKQAGVGPVAFDRRYYRFHGRVKALADGARKGGLVF